MPPRQPDQHRFRTEPFGGLSSQSSPCANIPLSTSPRYHGTRGCTQFFRNLPWVGAAHPDDLGYGATAAIARWTGQGKRISYRLVTSGEATIDGMSEDVRSRAKQRALPW